jgi:hypothetical protein
MVSDVLPLEVEDRMSPQFAPAVGHGNHSADGLVEAAVNNVVDCDDNCDEDDLVVQRTYRSTTATSAFIGADAHRLTHFSKGKGF